MPRGRGVWAVHMERRGALNGFSIRVVLKSFGENVTSDVSCDVERNFRILTKKLITQLAWKQRDEFIKTN
jgi:hypothetical protein